MEKLMGMNERPNIMEKSLRPKYAPRIELVEGTRPPWPIPIKAAYKKATAGVWARRRKMTLTDCTNEKTNTALCIWNLSPT